MRSTFKTQSEEKAKPRVSTDSAGIEGNRRKSVPARLLLGLRRCSVLLLVIGLVMSLAVPYVALGRVISYETMEFNGKAMLGYSLGGIEVGAYGVDINEWGQVEEEDGEPNVVMSNYGYWNKERAQYAKELLQGSPEVNMLPDENRAGWDYIIRDSSLPTPASEAALQKVDTSVAPMRRKADWEYWDSQPVGGSSPGMTVTIYPDFLILGWDGEHASVLRDPTDSSLWGDDEADSSGMHVRDTAAVPHYVPLSTLFEAFGLDKTVSDDEDNLITINTLIDAICADMRNGHSERLDEIVRNDTHSQDNDLLIGTHYENLNGVQGDDKQRDSASDAWNPYPYSMVFHQDLNPFGDAAGKEIVTSSIYNNTEAYAYLSPRSVYTQYMRLRSQYESLSALCHGDVCKDRPDFMLKLGYYLAGMSILEAYLNESLPQDMTRGYVGPTEGNPKVDEDGEALMDDKKLCTRTDERGTVSQLFSTCLSQVGSERSLSERNQKPSPSNSDNTKEEPSQDYVGFQEVAYSQLMYDFADSASVKYGTSGETTRLSDTNSIMNTLSTYGYGLIDEGELTNREDKSAGQGSNRGMSRLANMSRSTIFTPMAQNATTSVRDIDDKNDPLLNPLSDDDTNTGLYVPVYYPIQQHMMPVDPEMHYRLSILGFLPYETLMNELSQDNLTITPSGVGLSLAMRQGDIQHMKDVAQSVAANEMDADDVYDFVDIVRNVPHLRYETFMRHFNPLKGQVQSNDIFLTRISPAQTAYMPSLLTKGYESAGGKTNGGVTTTLAHYDFFSIPSLAPCLAAHMTDDTYYGTLSRELDVFTSRQFLLGVPADTSNTRLDSFMTLRDRTIDNLSDLADNKMDGLKRKIVTS